MQAWFMLKTQLEYKSIATQGVFLEVNERYTTQTTDYFTTRLIMLLPHKLLAHLTTWIESIWYKDHFIGAWLAPLSFIFHDIIRFRQFLYRYKLLPSYAIGIPVIIVGNITVGGTGKTPLLIALAQLLLAQGYRPGVISRGYGGQTDQLPQRVSLANTAAQVGDEALLLAKYCQCPVVVGRSKVAAARYLRATTDCTIILSDDGLQHYALQRDIEIAVIDGMKRFGNGYCLPAGPLREPINRLQTVDLIIVNGDSYEDNEFSMSMRGTMAVNLRTGEQRLLSSFQMQPCHALAGIGNPARFFAFLGNAGLQCVTHSFPDHHVFRPEDCAFKDDFAVLMTEKDAVKCTSFAEEKHWYVPIEAVPDAAFIAQLTALLKQKIHA
jgi:tetraacyldisaccharide 4'-kinase